MRLFYIFPFLLLWISTTALAFNSSTNTSFLVLQTNSSDCSLVINQPLSQQCQFINDNNCQSTGLINYYKLYYCRLSFLHNPSSPFLIQTLSILPLTICLILCFISVGITASEYLCPNLYTISQFLKLPDTLAGLTLLAFGNSSPDVFGTYHAIGSNSLNLAIAELIGASLFIMTVVVGTIAIIEPFNVPKNLFIRDCMMYIMVFALVVISLIIGELTSIICILLVSCYIIYVGIAIYSHSQKKTRINRLLREQRSRGQYSVENDGINNDNASVDEIYLDSIASLPTIDDLDLQQINDEVDNLQFELANGNSSTAGGAATATSVGGNFGLKMLINDLHQHSKIKGTIQLNSNRQLMSSTENEVFPTATPTLTPTPTNDHPILNLKTNDLLFLLLPQLNQWPEFSLYEKIYFIISLPIQFSLRLTTPIRDENIINTIMNDIHNLTYNNSNNNNNNNSDSTGTTTTPMGSSFDYLQDKKLLLVQTFPATLFLISSLFGKISSSKPMLIFLSLLLASALLITINIYYPKYYHHHQFSSSSSIFISRIKIINICMAISGFILSICWISLISDEIINILHIISIIYQLSEDILGLTIFALGNSIGDFISNYTIAMMGKPIMAFTACFGGPLLAICSSGLSGMIIRDSNDKKLEMKLTNTLIIICLSLFATLGYLMYIVPKHDWQINKKIGIILVSIWFITCSLCIINEIK